MNSSNNKVMKLVGIFLLGCILFNYPIMSLFNVDAFLMGLPLFYLYLFAGWGFIILFVLIIMETGRKQKKSDSR